MQSADLNVNYPSTMRYVLDYITLKLPFFDISIFPDSGALS